MVFMVKNSASESSPLVGDIPEPVRGMPIGKMDRSTGRGICNNDYVGIKKFNFMGTETISQYNSHSKDIRANLHKGD